MKGKSGTVDHGNDGNPSTQITSSQSTTKQ
jgi:hypothetical protein